MRSLGTEAYGIWSLIGSMVGYLGLLDLGVRGAVTRFVARHHARGDTEEANRFASTGMVVFSVTSVAVFLGACVLALVLHRFNIPAELLPRARLAMVFAGAALGTAFVNGVFGGIITARERFDLSSLIDVVVEGARLAAVVTFLSLGYGLVALALIQLATGTARLVISWLVSRRIYPELRPGFTGWSSAYVKPLVSYSLTTTALRSASAIILQLDAIVIAALLPVSAVTYFAIAGSLITYAAQLLSSVSQTISPRVSALEGAGMLADAQRVPVVASRITTMVLLPIVLTFMIRGDTFITLWMGPEYGELSGRILFVLSLPLLLRATRQVVSAALIGLDRHAILIPIYLVEAAANLVLSIVLARRIGVIGVAWGTAIPGVVVTAAVLPILYGRALQIPPRLVWLDTWLRPAVALTPFAVATWAIETWLPPGSLLIFFLQVALALPAALAGVWFVGLTDIERATLGGPLARRLRRS